MAKQWRFEHDEQAQWRWTLLTDGEETARSSRTFSNQLGCMMDAMRFVVQRTRPLPLQPKVDGAEAKRQPH